MIFAKGQSPKGATVWTISIFHLPSFHYDYIVAQSFDYLMAF